MSLISFEFIFFLPIVFTVYWGIPKWYVNARNIFLVIASYFFYGLIDLRFCFCLFGISLLTWLTSQSSEKRRKLMTSINIIVCLGVLCYFKYLNFFRDSICEVFSINNYGGGDLIVPLGLSFYIFMAVSYSIDTNRGLIQKNTSIVDFFAYISFFPHLLSGPVDRGRLIIPQLKETKSFDNEQARNGLRQILSGLFRKVVIADNVGLIVNAIWSDYHNLNSINLIIGCVLYSIQIYADFSGYSDIAIGVGKLFGIKLMQNFHFPYFSKTVSEFWHNWHISLTSWFTEYIYIPLGGNRRGKVWTIFNTLVVFSLCGLWHGASWNYVIWGFICGLMFIPSILYPQIKNRWKNKPDVVTLSSVGSMFGVFVLITVSWIFFRAPSLSDATAYIGCIFKNITIPFTIIDLPMSLWKIWVIVFVAFLTIEWIERKKEFALIGLMRFHKILRWFVYVVLLLLFFCYRTTTGEFIYQNF